MFCVVIGVSIAWELSMLEQAPSHGRAVGLAGFDQLGVDKYKGETLKGNSVALNGSKLTHPGKDRL